MDYRERASRRDRRSKRIPLIRIFIAVVIIILAVYAFYKFKMPGKPKSVPAVAVKAVPPANFAALADSLIMACCRSFGLSDTAFIESTESQTPGPAYHCFRQGWPTGLPFVVFAQRLNNLTRPRNLQCDCEESSRQGWLECVIKSGRQAGAMLTLDTGRKTRLAGREVALILDNLGAMDGKEIIKLIRNGVIFSYYGSSEFYPIGDMARLFGRGNITSIIKLPASEGGWKQLARFAKGVKKGQTAFEKTAMAKIISLHPGARAFVFDTLKGSDSEILKAVLNEARSKKMSYLCMAQAPDAIARTAIENGLSVLKLNLMSGDKELSQTKFDLIGLLLSEDSPSQIAVCVDVTDINADELASLKLQLDGIGVKLRPYMKLVQKVKKL